MISGIDSVGHQAFTSGVGAERAQRIATQGNVAHSTAGQGASAGVAKQLTAEQLQQVQQLAQTDRKVRAHEQAHLSAAADLVRGGPNYSYQTGPDSRQYAVSGEVSIDVSPARTPEETLVKAQRIRAAALAPADPSAQDNRVAALASRMEFDARIELARQVTAEVSRAVGGDDDGVNNTSPTRLYHDVAQNGMHSQGLGGGLDLFA